MWEKIKEVFSSAFAIFTTAWLLGHLIAVQIVGVVAITEGNRWILWFEIGFASLILILAIERFRRDWRNV